MQNIRVKITRDKSNEIRAMPLEEYLRGVVPAEMPAYSGAAALKAQTVAARTYAYQMILSRAEEAFDVDDTTEYQAYVPSKVDSRTDAAVKETAGQILAYGGKVLDTCVYTSANGGHTVSALERWPKGGGRPYLPRKEDPYDARAGYPLKGHGVGMSQRGAQQMAKEGKDFEAILAFYYPGTGITTVDIAGAMGTEKPGVEYYSLRNDGETKITANFKVKEFAAGTFDIVPICYELVYMLQRIRDHFGKAVDISCGFRLPESGTSQHCKGRAADFRITGVDPREIVRWIESEIDPPGLGLYDYNPKTEGKTGFVHIDARTGGKSRWYQTKKDDSDYTPIGSRSITDVYLNKKK